MQEATRGCCKTCRRYSPLLRYSSVLLLVMLMLLVCLLTVTLLMLLLLLLRTSPRPNALRIFSICSCLRCATACVSLLMLHKHTAGQQVLVSKAHEAQQPHYGFF
jgi:hypothetical protein